MQLNAVNHYIAQYKRFLKTRKAYELLHIWEAQRNFQDNWDLGTSELLEMYDRSLQNPKTKRLWKRENYEPKQLMLRFLEMEPEFVRSMFRDLFNEDKAVDSRASRFVFYCDQLLDQYKKAHPRSIENNHYHDDDYQMISIYLAFRFPDTYTIYQAERFRDLLRKLRSTDIPGANDIDRFFKVMRTLYKLLSKDEALRALHQQRLDPAKHLAGDNLLLSFDFYRYCTDPRSGVTEFIDPKGT